ncbi:hypothetical protein IV203_026390 [Nitzschia inconspicua]|uniref:Uncharacterized protein n=1 Tax=Nitzschia inconspicua TaxID=303405 RepID=A0A9K3LJT2_9STRA|nr:hypothetical protein IV203_026390 [Nitzschia inconspicua]
MDRSICSDSDDQSLTKLSASDISAAKQSLWDEAGQGLADVLVHARSAWYGEQAVYYTRERERLGSYMPPFYYGMAATAFVFVGFRITGLVKVQEWQRRVWRRWKRNQTTESASPITVQQSSPVTPEMGYLESKRIREREKALQSMKLITDLLVSISVGFSGTLFLLEAKRDVIRSDFEEAPLVSGRSVVAEQMCPGMLRLYHENVSIQNVLRRNDQTAAALKDRNLTSFAVFLQNCQKRHDYEARVRKERGKSKEEPIVVPYNGIQ